ncbi:sensor histidine kinase [Evtepia sp.]|uniref:sensor histidine kinase n=1 Tax=Evtepia sp. TaxID=2773933 RepID=UPI002A7F401A|nr:sensor histidine kinase [Evtepia sp.]MDY4431007.1 sensor histidine kinase [Evtepia sp.]
MRKPILFFSWLRVQRLAAAVGLLGAGVSVLVFWLYGLPGEGLVYTLVLWAAGFSVLGGVDFFRFRRCHRDLEKLHKEILVTAENLPRPGCLIEEDYQSLLRLLESTLRERQAQADQAMADQLAYYTLWVHQIKTPIAAMDLLLQQWERGPAAQAELFKISQYVDMALQYVRLDGTTRDLHLSQVSLDQVIRQVVRKYAKLFILKKIRLDFRETGLTVLSDEKWLAFLLEQLLSNALKYTPEGGQVAIFGEPREILVIADTGIGIAPEDLPRVFERGFTGQNGRLDKKATGIGLYLCRRVTELLGHTLSITSAPGKGTQVRVGLRRPDLTVE